MRLPDPIANTTTEAYLAYKAGVLNVGDLKPSLYDPYLHYDAWLAYWAGLVDTYPIHDVGKNLFNENDVVAVWINESGAAQASVTWWQSKFIPVSPNTTYTVTTHQIPDSGSVTSQIQWHGYSSKEESSFISGQAGLEQLWGDDVTLSMTFTTSSDCHYVRIGYRQERQEKVQLEAGSTATEYEPYTGTPEILTDEEALVAYLSGVTNTYPEEYSDPIDARITGYLRYLVSARFGRPDYPVNNIEFYLSLMKPPIVTNDTPSSNIELDNTAWAELIDVKMYGDTSQQTYTGKNLYAVANGSMRGVALNVAQDGSISVKGTNDNTGGSYFVVLLMPISLMTDGAEYICWHNLSSLPSGVEVRLGLNNGSSWVRKLMSAMSGTTNSRTFTANLSGGDSIRCEVFVSSGTTVDLSGLKIQLESGDQATAFEPYVGGVPAPNPDYQQAVQTVTGEQTVTIQGKNLLSDVLTSTRIYQGTTSKIEGDTWTVVKSGSGGIGLSPVTDYAPVNIPAGQPITYSTTPISGTVSPSTVYYQIRCYLYDADKNLVDNLTTNGTAQDVMAQVWSKTYTPAVDIAYVRLGEYIPAATGTTEGVTIKLQLEAGDQATAFEPYQSQEYEVNLGKNLFDKAHINVINGYPTGTTIVSNTYHRSIYIPVEPNTKYSVQKINKGNNKRFALATYSTVPAVDGTTLQFTQDHNADSLSITTASNARYLLVWVWVTNDAEVTWDEIINSLQIEKGSATPYAPYFTPIELCKIGTYQDYLYPSGGKWYLHKVVGKYKFTSSETGSYQSSFPRFSINFSHGQDSTAAVTSQALCTHLKVGQTANTNNTFGIGVNVIYLRNESCTSLVELNQWFGNNDVIVYYALATPTDTEITNAALVAQLDALAAAKSYNDKTYITVEATDPNLPALLKVEAGEYR